MNDSDFKEKVMYKLGQIDGKFKLVKKMDKKLVGLCKTVGAHTEKIGKIGDIEKEIEDHRNKIHKHDIAFAKAGAIITSVVFVLSITFNFIADWFRNK